MTTSTHSESVNIDCHLRDDILFQMRSNKFTGILKARPSRRNSAATLVKRDRGASTACSPKRCVILLTLCSLFSEHFNGEELSPVAARINGLELRHADLTCADVCTEANDQPTLRLLLSFDAFTGLCTLDLECNSLGDDGVAQLCAQCLPKLNHLSHLFIASNGIGIPGLGAIVEYTEKSHPLQAVGLTNNPLYLNDGEGESQTTALLLRLLRACQLMLRRVHLNHVGMPTQAALELIRVVGGPSSFQRLEAVYLKHNIIDTGRVQDALKESDGNPFVSSFKF